MTAPPPLSSPLIPLASEDDARATMAAALPLIEAAGASFIAVHVIEKAGGAPDKASVEQLEERAADIFAIVEELAAEAGVTVETDLRFHTDIVDGIFEAADEHDASAIVFTPREGSRWVELLTGDRTRNLVKQSDRPVLSLPEESVTTDE